MQIIYRMAIELTRRSALAPLDAVQGDGNTRAVKISLLENGAPWEVPAGVTAAVAFCKADGHKGLYDTLPDGTKAVTIDGSAVTAVLAPQVLSCAGNVSASVVFYDADLQQLATFPFTIRVEENPAAGQEISNDYYRYSTLEDVSKAVDAALASLEAEKQDFLAQAQEALQTVHDTATENAPAIVCEAMGQTITVADAANRPLQGLTLYGKTVQNGTPTPENPVPLESVGAGGAINTTVCGKNLLSYATFSNYDDNAVSVTLEEDGFLTLTNVSSYACFPAVTILNYKGKLFTTIEVVDSFGGEIYVQKEHNDYSSCIRGTGTKTFAKEVDGYFRFMVSLGVERSITFRAIVSADSNAEYEPYKEPQTLSVPTPNGLPGIPVTSGGNYTDENGQRWICDEIDFARGVYVKNIGAYSGTVHTNTTVNLGGLGWVNIREVYIPKGNALCDIVPFSRSGGWGATAPMLCVSDDKYARMYGNTDTDYTLRILYTLAEPIETALSSEEMAAFAALQSYKPNTTVYNDSGAGMKLGYTADTKAYIDQKLAAISAALLNA